MTVTINGTTGIDKVQDGSIVAADLASGVALSNIGTGGVTADYIASSAQPNGFKNRIINGAMMIDQRNAGASFSVSNGYTIDRWVCRTDTGSGNTGQQSTTVPTSGFKNSLLVTVGTGASPTAGQRNYIQQPIEGFNVSDLNWGSASAATITLSFWVRCSLTGTFGGALQNSAGDRSYPFTYTISSANTFEYKTITIAGDTTGTWLTTNGVGITLYIGLGCGSTFNGASGSWAAADYRSATGSTNVIATSGATFYITGVQLEKGSTATSFDYRPYGTELALCQRYYWQGTGIGFGRFGSATTAYFQPILPVPLRATPSGAASGVLTITQPGTTTSSQSAGQVAIDGTGGSTGFLVTLANFSGQTTGATGFVYGTNYVQLSAEL